MTYTGRDIDEAEECLGRAGPGAYWGPGIVSAIAEKIAGYRKLKEVVRGIVDSRGCEWACEYDPPGEGTCDHCKLQKVMGEIEGPEPEPKYVEEAFDHAFAQLVKAEEEWLKREQSSGRLMFGLPRSQKEDENIEKGAFI